MIAIHRKVALATAVFITLGMIGSQVSADQPGSGATHTTPLPQAEISGKISFSESYLPHAFNSDACQDFSVIAEVEAKKQPKLPKGGLNLNPLMTIVGKSGPLTAELQGSTVECAYSIQGLPAGVLTVVPQGHPRGYKPTGGTEGVFNDTEKFVTLKRTGVFISSAPNVNFVFETISQPK